MANKIASNITVNGIALDRCRKIYVNSKEVNQVTVNGVVVYELACIPTTPIVLSVGNATCEELVFTWNDTNGVPAVQYDIHYGDGTIFRENVTSPTTTSCSGGGNFDFFIRATNIAGSIDSNIYNVNCVSCWKHMTWDAITSVNPAYSFDCLLWTIDAFPNFGKVGNNQNGIHVIGNLYGHGIQHGSDIPPGDGNIGSGSSEVYRDSGEGCYATIGFSFNNVEETLYGDSNCEGSTLVSKISWDGDSFVGVSEWYNGEPNYEWYQMLRTRGSGNLIAKTQQGYCLYYPSTDEFYGSWIGFWEVTDKNKNERLICTTI